MFPGLEMNWLVEVTSERYHRTSILGAVEEFLWLDQIGEEPYLSNSCDGIRWRAPELPDV
jgi:hypothetical protein